MCPCGLQSKATERAVKCLRATVKPCQPACKVFELQQSGVPTRSRRAGGGRSWSAPGYPWMSYKIHFFLLVCLLFVFLCCFGFCFQSIPCSQCFQNLGCFTRCECTAMLLWRGLAAMPSSSSTQLQTPAEPSTRATGKSCFRTLH